MLLLFIDWLTLSVSVASPQANGGDYGLSAWLIDRERFDQLLIHDLIHGCAINVVGHQMYARHRSTVTFVRDSAVTRGELDRANNHESDRKGSVAGKNLQSAIIANWAKNATGGRQRIDPPRNALRWLNWAAKY